MKIKNLKFKIENFEHGSVLIYAVVVIFIFSLVLLGVLQFATSELRVVRGTANREQAFQIAEAGANYYQWRLAHFPSDFWDGNASTTPGPFIHDYLDKDTEDVIGQFKLTITVPATGTTVTIIKSEGHTLAAPKQLRTITVRYGVPSLAKYGFLTNENVWIGPDEHVSGAMHSNGGIRFDGTGNAPITSAKTTYSCPAWSGSPCPATKPGIWGSAPEATKNFWQMSQPSILFSSLSNDLNAMRSKAKADPAPAYLGPSNKYGYSFVFNANGTADIYLVKSLRSTPSNGWDVYGNAISQSIDYDPAQLQQLYSHTPIPPSGIFFAEDNVWVEGTVKGKVQVVAAVPSKTSGFPNLYIANNLLYTTNDGSDILGLLSQGSIVPVYYAPTNLTVNAAMVAQNGSIQIYQYPNNTNVKNSITINGSLASFGLWTWTYVDGSNTAVSGYANTYTNYDSNLLYGAPPSFPLSTDGYQQISWTSD